MAIAKKNIGRLSKYQKALPNSHQLAKLYPIKKKNYGKTFESKNRAKNIFRYHKNAQIRIIKNEKRLAYNRFFYMSNKSQIRKIEFD